MYVLAAIMLILIGIAHSYLGERYLLIRLFRREDLPKILGSETFTKNTLRFAWHLTTVAWFGFAALLMQMGSGTLELHLVANVIAITFFVHFLIAIWGSRGRHLSWVIFLAISLLTFYANYG